MADATCSERRLARSLALALSLTALLSAGALAVPAPALAQQADKKAEKAGKRKVKRVKALSLAAQKHIIRVTKVLEKYGQLGDEADATLEAARTAAKDIETWKQELAELEPDKGEKQRVRLQDSIAKAEALIAAAPARAKKLQQDALAQIARALPALDAMRATQAKLQSQDKAAMWNYYGYVYAILERFREARDAYESMLAEEEMADNLRLQALYASGQLSMVLEEFARGVRRLEEWFDFSVALGRPVRAGDHFLLAQGYYSLKRYEDVLKRIDLAIQVATEAGQPLKENWLRLMVATHFSREDFVSARAPLELLVLMFPKREYWLQLQGTYGELELRDKQLAILDLAWRQGLLEREPEYISLAQHLQQAEDPLQAALVMEEGIDKEIVDPDFDNARMLGGFWQRAQETEKALQWFREADELTDTGEMQYRIALLLNLENRLEEFLEAAREAYRKGDFASRDDARLLIGQGLLELGRLEEALEVFEAIDEEGDEEAKERVATWLQYASKQLEARQAIEETIDLYRKQEAAILAAIADQ